MRRPGSPRLGFSILTTSAPSQASASVLVGPASNWVRSTTRTPLRQLRGAKFPLIVWSPPAQRMVVLPRIAHKPASRKSLISANSPALRSAIRRGPGASVLGAQLDVGAGRVLDRAQFPVARLAGRHLSAGVLRDPALPDRPP